MLQSNEVYLGDCLEIMKDIEDQSIDMILCDLPYGMTASSWDIVIPMDKLWEQYKRIIKPKSAIVLTASQPFASALVMSNRSWFRHEWIWHKDSGSNFLGANHRPLKVHESILVFSEKAPFYYPIKTKNSAYKSYVRKQTNVPEFYFDRKLHRIDTVNTGDRFPRSVINFNISREGLHPTQKPVTLFEYLIKTYSTENDLILDNCAGSGTTAIAALNTNRCYILIEKDPHYYSVINKRIEEHSTIKDIFYPEECFGQLTIG